MTSFYICRHGETENNKNKVLSGWVDTPLTGQGVQNALSVASKLKGVTFDKVISSDLGRAFRTAYLVTREIDKGLYIDATAALREVNYGDIANTPYVGPSVAYPKLTPEENATYVPPNGESLVQMQQRIVAYVRKISQENPGKTILLVAHDGTINALYAAFAHKHIGVVDAESNNTHDCVVKLEVDEGKIISFDWLESR